MSQQSFFDGGPKTMFYSGLFLGVALTMVIGFGVAFGLLASGASFGGNAVAVNNPTPTLPTDTDQPQAPAGPVKPVDEKTDHIKGAKNAKVTIIEYSDFQCPFCTRHLPTIEQALKDFPQDVRVVYRHFPLSFHPEAQKAAEASECAAKLGGNDAFWKMHDQLFAKQSSLGTQTYKDIAKQIGLNEGNFSKCLESGEMAGRVQKDEQEGAAAGVNGTPANFINGKLESGAIPYNDFKAILQKAGASK